MRARTGQGPARGRAPRPGRSCPRSAAGRAALEHDVAVHGLGHRGGSFAGPTGRWPVARRRHRHPRRLGLDRQEDPALGRRVDASTAGRRIVLFTTRCPRESGRSSGRGEGDRAVPSCRNDPDGARADCHAWGSSCPSRQRRPREQPAKLPGAVDQRLQLLPDHGRLLRRRPHVRRQPGDVHGGLLDEVVRRIQLAPSSWRTSSTAAPHSRPPRGTAGGPRAFLAPRRLRRPAPLTSRRSRREPATIPSR